MAPGGPPPGRMTRHTGSIPEVSCRPGAPYLAGQRWPMFQPVEFGGSGMASHPGLHHRTPEPCGPNTGAVARGMGLAPLGDRP
jgi:hypothetical protein